MEITTVYVWVQCVNCASLANTYYTKFLLSLSCSFEIIFYTHFFQGGPADGTTETQNSYQFHKVGQLGSLIQISGGYFWYR
jgi:hypothetical protein